MFYASVSFGMTLPEKVLQKVESGLGPCSGAVQGGVRTYREGGQGDDQDLTSFAGACQETLIGVLDAIATVGGERTGHLKDAKLAVDKA